MPDASPPTITQLEPLRRYPDRMALTIDGEPRCTVACDVLAAEQLRVGTVLSAATLERLMRLDAEWKARESALSLLAVRPRARGELIGRLRRKGHDDSAVAAAIAYVERLGYIDDTAFAESWVRDRLRLRPRGVRMLAAELARKGVDADVARSAIARVMAQLDVADDDLCYAAAEKWIRRHAADVAHHDRRRSFQRRLTGFLARRGYGTSAIRTAVAVLAEPVSRTHSAAD